MITIGIISHAFAFLAFSALTIVLVVSRQKNERSGSLLLASGFSALWALFATLQSANPALFWAFGGAAESVRMLAWAYFLYSVLNQSPRTQRLGPTNEDSQADITRKSPDKALLNKGTSVPHFPLLILALALAHVSLWGAGVFSVFPPETIVRLISTLWILVCITALLVLERFVRATPAANRPATRYLTIGLGAMFLFDFVVFTDAQLFSRINTDLWFARGFAYSLMVPLIALSIARNPQWSVTLHVSRQAVTSSVTAIAGGAYLLITALAAYFVRFSGLEWASVAEVVVIIIALVALALLVFSTSLRSRMRVYVSKHLFNFKYDYRHEWLNFTETLATNIGDTPNSILQGLTRLVNTDGGTLWRTTKLGRVEIIASRGTLKGLTISETDAAAIERFMMRTQWLIDLDEVREHPKRYEGMSLSQELLDENDAWLILPLFFRQELLACLMFERSLIQKEINWEDRDLLKTAGRQAATLLKQDHTQSKLAEASQFQAFSKLSAYIVHDLKNIIGQQSLLVSNAARHKHNPEFVDDVITTVDNSVKRMQALLEQLRTNRADEQQAAQVDIVKTLESIVSSRANRAPVPKLDSSAPSVIVSADPDRLQRVFGHLVQNAQEATPADGAVSIHVGKDNSSATVSVQDTGSGMTEDFVQNSLFKAFESTKGLTGMGIGVFESREYVHSLGGDISVTSEPGVGTVFHVKLPLVTQAS